MKLDVHTHTSSGDPAHLREFIGLCEKFETRVCIFTPGTRGDHPNLPNEATLQSAKEYPEWLIPFAYINLWDTVDPACIDTFVEQGFKGLKCIAPYYAYDHDLYMPIYEKAEKYNLPIVFHTGAWRPNQTCVQHHRPMLQNMRPLALDRVARSFQNLKIVIAHLGTKFFCVEAAEMVKLHKNVYFDLAGCGNYWSFGARELVDLLACPYELIDGSYEVFRKMLLGSDGYIGMPFQFIESQKAYDDTLRRIGLPEEIKKGIMGGTVESWLGI
jgi:predicted TIM-barrel fold metal-dependent hydrolase